MSNTFVTAMMSTLYDDSTAWLFADTAGDHPRLSYTHVGVQDVVSICDDVLSQLAGFNKT